jgi:uncharacterized membrane protein YhaH (DUF805 family)
MRRDQKDHAHERLAMSFQDAVRTCLQLKYADFNGRARRSEYWWFALFVGLLFVVLEILFGVLGQASSTLTGIMGLLLLIVAVGLIVPSLAVGARRLHDTGKSGWWLLLNLVPFGGIVLLVFFLLDSTPGPNQHGANPKGIEPGYGYGPVPPPAPSQF